MSRSPLAAVGATGAVNVAVTALTLVNGVLMARLLGPANRGFVFTVVALPTAAAALVGSFAYPALVRRAAQRGSQALDALCLQATLPLAAASTALAALMVMLAGGLDGGQRLTAAGFALAWCPASLLILNFQAVDAGRARWRRYNVLRLLPYPVILAGLALCFAAGRRDPGPVLLLLLASNLPPLAARLWLARGDGAGADPGPARPTVAELAGEARPFAAATAGAAAIAHADQVVAALVLPRDEAGLYAVAQRAGLLLTPLVAAIGVVSLSEAARGDGPGPRWRVPALAGLVAATLVLAPAVWLLVPVLYGAAFAEARLPALLALAAGLVGALAEVRERALEGAGQPMLAAPGRLLGTAVLALAALSAGLRWGATGIAAAAVLAQGLRALVLGRVLVAERARA